MPRYHSRDLRKGRISETARIYHVTTVTRNRRPVFRNPPAPRILVQELRHADESAHATTLAFVVMPDHLHWLMQLQPDVSLPEVMRQVKGRSAAALTRTGLAHAPVWQRGYHDHALRAGEDVISTARYSRESVTGRVGNVRW